MFEDFKHPHGDQSLTKGLESQNGRDCLKCLGNISASEKQEVITP